MAITTLDGLLAGMQPPKFFDKAISPTLVAGMPNSAWYRGGIPGAGSADTSTANGVVRSSTSALVAGQIPHYDPAGGSNSYLARLCIIASQGGVLELCDRLWDCGAISTGAAISPTGTGSQTINSATWPARDNTGTTNGVGVFVALEVSTALGAGTPTYTLTYTNSAGTGSRTGTNIFASVASSAIGTFLQFGVTAGDVGVQSVQSVQASATQTSGQWVLVAYRMLTALEVNGNYAGNDINALTSGFPQIFNGTVPFLVFNPTGTAAAYISGSYVESQG